MNYVARLGASTHQADLNRRAVGRFGSVNATAATFGNGRDRWRKRWNNIHLHCKRHTRRADIAGAVSQRCREVESTAAARVDDGAGHRHRRVVEGNVAGRERIRNRRAAPIERNHIAGFRAGSCDIDIDDAAISRFRNTNAALCVVGNAVDLRRAGHIQVDINREWITRCADVSGSIGNRCGEVDRALAARRSGRCEHSR